MIVYLAQDIPAFVLYCVYGASRSSLLIESTYSMIFFHFSYEGYTPLSRASRAGKEEIVSLLLSMKDISPNKRNKEKVSNLMYH